MGRVAKYKKVKSFDPYSKKNNGQVDLSTVGVWGFGDSGRKVKKRSRRAEQLRQKNKKKRMNDKEYGGFDLPPTDTCGDDFDLSDIVGTVKKQKKVMIDNSDDGKVGKDAAAAASNNNNDDNKKLSATKSTSATAAIEDDYVVDEKKVARILKLEQHDIEKKQKQNLENELYKRRDGESRNAYLKRTKKETRSIIQQTHQKQYNPEKRQRKKEFLTNKKKKQKKGNLDDGVRGRGGGSSGSSGRWGGGGGGGDTDGDDDDAFAGGRNGKRYSRTNDDDDDDDTDRNEKDTMIVFGEQVERPPVFRQLPRGAKQQSKQSATKKKGSNKKKNDDKNAKTTMTEEEIDAESHAMDLMRRKIQAQYAAIKRSRRQHGDFHL